ncbi:MAG: hypothetical protein HYX75_11705 [Acidobacteria bacterium]|nr:hypothetical protein [Acidobacteriota bacterium]
MENGQGVMDLADEWGHEELIFVRDRAAGLRAVIAIHDTTLGPAVGGTRMRMYPSIEAAAIDALRLSRAMTCKAAMAEMAWGGAKAVIVGDPQRDKTPVLIAAYADVLNRIGHFHTGADMGIDGGDVAALGRLTKHISQVPAGSSVDAADLTAIGVVEAMRATAAAMGANQGDLRVAIQGLGEVGWRLACRLASEGVRLLVADTDGAKVRRAITELGARAVSTDSILDVEADVFSPNAGGGILNDATIPRLRCRAIVGAANEQLAEPRHGDLLHDRGIIYAPDYVVNAGGLLSLLYETGETDEPGIIARVTRIGRTVATLLERSETDRLPPHRLADKMVEEKLAAARKILTSSIA